MKNLENLIELAKALPDSHRNNALDLLEVMGSTIEGISDKPIEWRPPMLKLVQAMTDRSKLPKGANIGSLILGEEIIESPVEIIPIRGWDSRQFWSPDKDDASIICQSPDAVTGYKGSCRECPHSKFDEEAKKSDCSKSKTFLVITADFSKIFTIQFTKTNYSNGMDWVALQKKAGVTSWKRVYRLASEPSKKVKNVEAIVVSAIEDRDKSRTPDALWAFLEALFRRVDEDRKEHLLAFAQNQQQRAGNNALAYDGGSKPDDEIAVVEEAPAEEVSKAAEASKSMSKKYDL